MPYGAKDIAKLRRLRMAVTLATAEMFAHRKEMVAQGCPHPATEVIATTRIQPDSYGRSLEEPYHLCSVCLAERWHGRWSGPNPRTSGEYSVERE